MVFPIVGLYILDLLSVSLLDAFLVRLRDIDFFATNKATVGCTEFSPALLRSAVQVSQIFFLSVVPKAVNH
jgi:hypothetical protein